MKYNPRLGRKTGRETANVAANGFGFIEAFFLCWTLLAASGVLGAGYLFWKISVYLLAYSE